MVVVLSPKSAKFECNWTPRMEHVLQKKEKIELAYLGIILCDGDAHVEEAPNDELPNANVNPDGPQLTNAQATSLALKRKEGQWTRYDSVVAKNKNRMKEYFGVLWSTLSQESKNGVATEGGAAFVEV